LYNSEEVVGEFFYSCR